MPRVAARRAAALPLVATLLVRLPFLAGAWGASFLGDELQYGFIARGWATHGAYSGQWPPGHPALVALCFELFGEGGMRAARVVLTLLSVVVCAQLMRLARALAGGAAEDADRAALWAGWLFAVHLPLVPYAHIVLSETPYLVVLLPALTALARAAREGPDGPGWRLAVAGAWLGASALVRESSLVLLACVVPWAALVPRGRGRAGLRAAALVAAGAVAVIAPWTARNLFAYGKVVPVSITSGTNAYLGWNATYINFDLVRLADPNPADAPGHALRARLLGDPAEAPPRWPRSRLANVAARDGAHLAAGLRFAREHPGFMARTRLVKLSDQFTPLSYLVKYLRLGTYGAPLEARPVRRGLAWIAVAQEVLLWLLVAAALAAARLAPGARSLVLVTGCALSVTALVVAMSRFRAPLEAVLLAVVAVLLAGPRERPGPRRLAACAAGLGALAFLWYLALPPTLASLAALAPEAPR